MEALTLTSEGGKEAISSSALMVGSMVGNVNKLGSVTDRVQIATLPTMNR